MGRLTLRRPWRRPAGTLGDQDVRVLLALLERRHTIRSLADELDTTFDQARRSLLRLRDAGVVTWEPGAGGTLRPLVRPVATAS